MNKTLFKEKSPTKGTISSLKKSLVAQGTIVPHRASIAQGTIEYLVIIAVVILIALVVVVLILNMTDTSQTQSATNKGQNLIGKSGISIVESIVSSTGDGVIVIQNTSGEKLTLKNIDTEEEEIVCEKILSPGDKHNCYLTNIDSVCPCTAGQKVTCDFKINFETKEGIKKTENFTLTNDCTNQIITPPVVDLSITLVSPINGQTVNSADINTYFTFYTNKTTNDCNLYLRVGQNWVFAEKNSATINPNTNTILDANLALFGTNLNSWKINCTNETNSIIESKSRTINYTLSTPSTYTVLYDANTGSGTLPLDPNNYSTGTTVTVLGEGTLTKSGHTFLYWKNNSTGQTYEEGDSFQITTNTTLYAQWNPIKYTITYDANTGSGTVPTDSTQYNSGSSVTILSQGNLVKSGYNFSNWKNNSSGQTYSSGQTFTITQNTTLYAQWTPVVVTQISNCTQLQNMNQNLSGHYEIINNINCSGVSFTPVGNSTNKFTGSLNGNYYKIQNLQITNSGSVDNIGLFGYTENAIISKLVMENTSINAYRYIGSIVGTAKNSTISECGASVNISTGAFERGLNYGGIVGRLEGGLIDKCYMTGAINTQGYGSAGIAGYLAGGTISNCYTNGNFTAGREGAAGIVGNYTNGPTSEIKNSYTRGTSTAGHAGYAAGIISSVWNEGTNLTINDSYSTMNNIGSNKGGLISSSKATINNSYYTTTGNFNYGTKVNDPTVFLQNSHAVYSEWDFDTTWNINPGRNDGYPYLLWEEEIN